MTDPSPENPSRQQSHRAPRFPRSRRSVIPVAALGMLVIAGGALGVGSPWRIGDPIAGTPAAAAQVETPPAAAMPSFAGLIERLKPAVVSVYVEAELGNAAGLLEQRGNGENSLEPNSPFEFFFRQFGPPGGRPAQRVRAQGSGFFISSDGYILTNNHVVDHAKRVQIKTVEGRTLDAKVVGTDPKTDLAVLKVAGSGHFPFVRFAETPPRVGDWVLAMGNPFGLGGTVTAGIVSATGRDIGAGPYDDYLQIDAPVNKGNSGGPSFNMQGEVIGVNTAIYSPSGGSVGIAFDIPAATAKSVAEQLEKTGVVNRGWIGVTVQPVTADIAESLGLSRPQGALVDDVQRGSPAAKAGVHSGDVIVSVDGTAIKDARDLARRIAEMTPGKTLTAEVRRNGGDKALSVTAAPYPSDRARAEQSALSGTSDNGGATLGLYLAPATELAGAGAQGVVVMGVDPNGIAAASGLQQGDVILEAGGKAVTGGADVRAAVDAARKSGKHSVLMRVKTADSTHFVAVPVKAS